MNQFPTRVLNIKSVAGVTVGDWMDDDGGGGGAGGGGIVYKSYIMRWIYNMS